MKSPTPQTQSAECIFRKQYLFVLLTLQIKDQGQVNHDTTFENSQKLTSGIHNSTIRLTCQGFIFKSISLHDWQLI